MTALLLALLGCGGAVRCADPAQVVAEAGGRTLTCADADVVPDYVEALAGRPLAAGDEALAVGAVGRRFSSDPEGTATWLGSMSAALADLRGRHGLDLAEARSGRVWAAEAGQDLVRSSDGDLWNVQDRALSVWTKDDGEHLALTEADIEAWIRYASLCREVQGGESLRISVADRVTVYQMVIDRFQAGDRATKVALAGFGPHWAAVRDAWQAASYEDQQRWIAAAPLPPPMTATSKAYFEALLAGDLARHVQILDDQLGPFVLPGAAAPTPSTLRDGEPPPRLPLDLER